MKYLRRLIWYVTSRLLIAVSVLGLMTMAFYFSMNATNIYIILKDGMAKRAQVVMMGADEELSRYFSSACLDRDALLIEARNGQSAYQNYYSITGFYWNAFYLIMFKAILILMIRSIHSIYCEVMVIFAS